MYIFRWLMKYPAIIFAVYSLTIVAVLYSMTGSSLSDTVVPAIAKIDSTAIDLSDTSAIETSTTMASATNSDNASKDTIATEVENTVKVTEVVDNTQFNEMNADELLLMAREAYWNNGLDESAQIYQQLINLNPNVVDYKGELGNVYWRQGFPKKAAELYAEISLSMIADGNADRVANMVGFIGLFFPEKATEIHNTLQIIN